MSGETWRPVVGYENTYRVSNAGAVESIPRPRTQGGQLKARVGKRGYPVVALVQDGRQSTRTVHSLVAEAFIGPRPMGLDVRHLDGNPLNPAASNLAYGSRSENMRDTLRHGTHAQAAKTACPRKHPYDEENTRWYRGRRYCRRCDNEHPERL